MHHVGVTARRCASLQPWSFGVLTVSDKNNEGRKDSPSTWLGENQLPSVGMTEVTIISCGPLPHFKDYCSDTKKRPRLCQPFIYGLCPVLLSSTHDAPSTREPDIDLSLGRGGH